MTKTKKILSIVVALVLVFSMVTTIASAAIADGKKVALILSADSLTVEAGQTITLTLSAETNAEFDAENYSGAAGIGNTCAMFAYDSSKVDVDATVKSAAADAALLNPTVYMNPCDGVDANMQYSSAFAAGMFDELLLCADGYEDDYAAKGWDSAVASILMLNENVASGSDICTFKFKVADDLAAGTKFTIGIPEGCLYDGNGNTYASISDTWEIDMEPCYDLSQAELEFTVGAAVTVESKGTMAHMNNWEDTEATTYTAGLVGQINGLALTFDETTGECNEIEEIKVTIEGSEKVGYAYKVYKVDDTTYQFRAILLDAPKAGTTALNYTFHVKLADGSTVTCSDSTTAKEIFDAAYARYEAAKNA